MDGLERPLKKAERERFDCGVLVTGDSGLTTPVEMAIGEFGKVVGVPNPQCHCCQTIHGTFSKLAV